MPNDEGKPKLLDLKGMDIQRLAKVLGIDVTKIEEQANIIAAQLKKLNERIEKVEKFQNDINNLAKKYGVSLSSPNPSPPTQMIPQITQTPQGVQVPQGQYPVQVPMQTPMQAQNNQILALLLQAMGVGRPKSSVIEQLMTRSMARSMLLSDYLNRALLKKFAETEFKSYLKELTEIEKSMGVSRMEYTGKGMELVE